MALNKLVSGDCGGNNSLVQLSNIVKSNASVSQPLSQSDRFVNEFIAQTSQAPQTFNMNSLLNNLPETESMLNKSQPIQHYQVPVTSHMSNIPWSTGPSRTVFMPPHMLMQNMFRPQRLIQPHSSTNVQFQYVNDSQLASNNVRAGAQNYFEPENVNNVTAKVHEYVENEEAATENVRAKAQEYVENTEDDPDLAYNQFMSFMKRVSAPEMYMGSEQVQSNVTQGNTIEEIAEKYKEEWSKLSDVTDIWNSENANGIAEEYSFAEGNTMLEIKNALEIGKEKLKMGDIPGAVLCFEAAAQQQPDAAEAWFYLGTTQAENEQDPLAITALKKSLSIDPRQLEAYITLAAAYTNENMPKYAFNALLDWLRASPKYSDLFPLDVDTKRFDLKELETYVKGLYLRAVQLNPTEIDADVQNALGVVFNLSQEYDKAVDCFKTALMVANNNAKLWNRLGATLANSERSEEAVEAYHEALNLEPGFIRARYNVGITCMNLGAYKQAAEHFLVTLNQQYKAKGMFPDQSTSDPSSSTIWTTLRMVCSFMGEHDVVKLVDERNLTKLNEHFNMGNN